MIIGWEGHEYSNIIHEYSPTESKFIKNERYVTSENSFILWVMWIKVWAIWQEYHCLNLRKNSSSLVDLMKFNYLELIESKTKN